MWPCSEARKLEATLATALASSLMTSTPVAGLVLGVGHTLLVAGAGDRVHDCMIYSTAKFISLGEFSTLI